MLIPWWWEGWRLEKRIEGKVVGWVLTGGWLLRDMTRFGSDLGGGGVGCLGLRFTWLLLRFW